MYEDRTLSGGHPDVVYDGITDAMVLPYFLYKAIEDRELEYADLKDKDKLSTILSNEELFIFSIVNDYATWMHTTVDYGVDVFEAVMQSKLFKLRERHLYESLVGKVKWPTPSYFHRKLFDNPEDIRSSLLFGGNVPDKELLDSVVGLKYTYVKAPDGTLYMVTDPIRKGDHITKRGYVVEVMYSLEQIIPAKDIVSTNLLNLYYGEL